MILGLEQESAIFVVQPIMEIGEECRLGFDLRLELLEKVGNVRRIGFS